LVNIVADATCTRRCTQGHLKIFCFMHPEGVRDYINFWLHEHIHGYTVSRSQRLSINYAMRRDYLSSSHNSSTSTAQCAATTRLPVARALPQLCHAPSCRSTSHWSVALALAVRPVPASRGVTTRHPDCTSSTAPMLCIRTRRLAARLLVSRSHWLSPCAWSFRCAP
jgi:hypothetical protein